jgi:hypothetical protein
MAQFTIYASTDASAPVLNGVAGSLLTVLDACLVNGYGSQVQAGWSKPFANSGNIGCYTNAGTGLSVSINDNGPGGGTGKEARATGYEVLTSVSTGTGPFPNVTQGASGAGFVVIRKSNSTSSTARDWFVIADNLTFYLFMATQDVANAYMGFMFGDFFSLKSATDSYRCMIIGRTAENSDTSSETLHLLQSNITANSAGKFIARSYGGGGTSIQVGTHGDSSKTNSSFLNGVMQFPNGPDGALYLTPVWVHESSTSTIRGRLRGFYQQCHPDLSFSDGTTFSGAGDYAGKTFRMWKLAAGNGGVGIFTIETSATLETNS